MCIGVGLHLYLWTTCILGALEGQKKGLALHYITLMPEELALQIDTSHHQGAGNQTQVLWKNSQYS